MTNKDIFKKKFFSQLIEPLVINSKFSIIFPRYQEKNLIEKWFIIKRILRFYYLETILNLKKGIIEISTTNKTMDPYSLINGRDFLKLLSRGVPIHHAAKIFNEDVSCDIIKISSFTQSKKIFLSRRKRLVGNNGSTVKAIEILTKSYILVQGNTVSCIGNFKNIKICRKIIEDCMENIHPFIHIRGLLIKKKLLKSPTLKHASWEEFLPLETRNKKIFFIEKKILQPRKIQKEGVIFSPIQNSSRHFVSGNKHLEERVDFNFKITKAQKVV